MSRQRMRLGARVFPILTILFLIAGVRAAKADSISIDLPSLLPGCLPATTATCDSGVSSVSGIFGDLSVEMSAFRAANPGFLANLSVRLDTSGSPSEPFVGIIGATQDDEIDLFTSLEMLMLEFGTAVKVNEIDINKLFLAGFAGDTHSEQGQVFALLGGVQVDSFSFTGTSSTGRLTLFSPFGGKFVDELRFIALDSGAAQTSANSDYGLSSLVVTPIPEPSTLLLLGSGVALLAAKRRKRTKS